MNAGSISGYYDNETIQVLGNDTEDYFPMNQTLLDRVSAQGHRTNKIAGVSWCSSVDTTNVKNFLGIKEDVKQDTIIALLLTFGGLFLVILLLMSLNSG